MKGGRSPTEVANLANGAAPQRGALAGGRGRPDRKRVLHADEEPQLARAPHHRLPDEAVYEFSPDRDGERLRGQGRVQHRQRLSHGARSPAPFAKEIAAWPPAADPLAAVWDSEVVQLLKRVSWHWPRACRMRCGRSAALPCSIAATACRPPSAISTTTRGRIRRGATRRCARITACSRPATIEA